MGIRVGDITLGSNVLLAPMAGITDPPFRRLVRRFGAGLTTSEMVASGEFETGRAATLARAEIGGEALPSIQIAGREAGAMARCAKTCVDQGARIIDINMGCPAKKVTGGLSGAALMRDPDNALRLIEAVVGAVPVPVTLKMRLGWRQDELTAATIARRAQGAGVRMLAIHGRTRQQFYKGHADWAAIRAVKDSVSIPVIANGDITDLATAQQALRLSGADGVMVGRGVQGAPWILSRIAARLEVTTPPPTPTGDALWDMIACHYEDMLGFYGADLGVRVARKHLSWHLARIPGARPLRDRLMRETDPNVVLAALASGAERIAA